MKEKKHGNERENSFGSRSSQTIEDWYRIVISSAKCNLDDPDNRTRY